MSNVTHQPKIGFVSLGCPKNLVDSERILTELRTEGYDVVPTYDNADMVIVNTCGFIDSAVQESLEAIGEALKENGKVIVTGCLGAKEDQIREVHPKVLLQLEACMIRSNMNAHRAIVPVSAYPRHVLSRRAPTPAPTRLVILEMVAFSSAFKSAALP